MLKAIIANPNESAFLGHVNTKHEPHRTVIGSNLIACAVMRELDLAKDSFDALKIHAVNAGDTDAMNVADVALAQLYFGHLQDHEKAINLWDTIVKNKPGRKVASEVFCALAPTYLTMAKESSDQTETERWVSKLAALVDIVQTWNRENDRTDLPDYEPLTLLGRWYADEGQAEKARTLIRPMIKQCIQDLTDRNVGNDRTSYGELGRALLSFGDRKNAEIAYAFNFPLQKSRELIESERTSSQEALTLPEVSNAGGELPAEALSWGPGWECDGLCSRRKVHFKTCSMCEICVDIGFCDECLQQLVDGTAKSGECNSKHPMLEVYPPKGLVSKDYEGYKVHTDGGVITIQTWLERISREWEGA